MAAPDAGFVPEDNNAKHPYTLVRTTPAGLGFVSGVLPYGDDGRLLRDRDAAVPAVLDGLRRRLAAEGFELDHVVKTTVYLIDLAWRDAVNAAFYAAFAAPRPARSAVQVSALPGGAQIELDAVAIRP